MEQLRYDNRNDKQGTHGVWSIHSVAMFMLAVYVVLSSAFEFFDGYSFLNTLSLYTYLGLGGLNILYKKKVRFLDNYYFVGIFLYFVIITVSLLYAPLEGTNLANRYYYRFFTVVVICLVTINLIENKKDLNYFINVFIFSGLVMAVIFVAHYGEQIFSLAEQVEEAERLGRDFGNINAVAQKLAFSVVFSIYMAMFKTEGKRLFYIVVAVISMVVILLTGSRKSFLVIIVASIYLFYAFLKDKDTKYKVRALIIAVISIIIIACIIINVPLFSTIKLRIEATVRTLLGIADSYESKSDANRIRYLSESFKYWIQKPFLGNGLAFSFYLFGTYSHNNYMELLLNTGIVGFFIYYYPFLKTFLYVTNKESNFTKEFKVFTICMIIVIAVIDIGVVSYYDRYICIAMSAISSMIISGEPDD